MKAVSLLQGPPCPNPPCGIGGGSNCVPPPCIPIVPYDWILIVGAIGIGMYFYIKRNKKS